MQVESLLLDALVGMHEAKLDVFRQLVVDEPFGSYAIDLAHRLVEIVGRDIQFIGIEVNRAMLLVVLVKQSEELYGFPI